MPQIPKFTAGGAGGTRSANTGAGIPHYDYAERINAQVNKFAESTAEQIGLLKSQRDSTELIEVRSEYEAGTASIHQDLARDPILAAKPEAYIPEFVERSQKLQKDLIGSMSSPGVKQYAGNMFAQMYPKQLIHAKAEGLKLGTNKALADLDKYIDITAQNAATAPDVETRDFYVGMGQKKIDSMVGPFLTADKAQIKRRELETKFQTNHMSVLASSDPQQLDRLNRLGAFTEVDSATKARILEHAENKIHRSDLRTEQVTSRARTVMEDNLIGLATQGKLDQSIIDDVKHNKMAPLHPAFGIRLQEIVDSPKNSGQDFAVRAMRAEFNTEEGRMTEARVNLYKGKLRDILMKSGGRVSNEMESFSDYLNSRLETMRTQEGVEFNNAVKQAGDLIKATERPSILPAPFSTQAKNREKILEAETNVQIKNSKDRSPAAVKEIVKQAREKEKADRDAKADKIKKLNELRGK